jgi:hypothetical protein
MMKRGFWISLAALAAGVLPVSADAAPAPRALLEGMVCARASNPLDRAVGITAVMRPVAGTERMELRFQLLRRPAGAPGFSEVQGGDLGVWRHPTDPATLGQRPDDVWRLNKQVANLAGPAVYRFRVTFRWKGTSGRVLEHLVRLSELCSQPG